MHRKISPVALLLATVLATAACGGGEGHSEADTTPADSAAGSDMVTGTTGAPGPGTVGTPGTPAAPEPDTTHQ